MKVIVDRLVDLFEESTKNVKDEMKKSPIVALAVSRMLMRKMQPMLFTELQIRGGVDPEVAKLAAAMPPELIETAAKQFDEILNGLKNAEHEGNEKNEGKSLADKMIDRISGKPKEDNPKVH